MRAVVGLDCGRKFMMRPPLRDGGLSFVLAIVVLQE